MRESHLKIEPFNIVNLLSLEAYQEVNEHGLVKLKGRILQENEDEYLSLGFGGVWLKIGIVEKGGKTSPWFEGIVTDLELESDDIETIIHITAKTGSYLMDNSIHTRSYQDPSMPYNTVLSSYTTSYPGGNLVLLKIVYLLLQCQTML